MLALLLAQLAPTPVNPNPIASPADVPDWFDQVYEAIHMHQYYGLASLLLFGFVFGIKALSKKFPPDSKAGKFFASDRGMMLTLLLTSLLGGFATAIGKGVKIDGPLIWTAVKAAGGATFIFSLVFKLLFPKAQVPSAQPEVAPSSAPAAQDPKPPATVIPPSAKTILLLAGLGMLATSCKCFTPSDPAFNTPECVLARKSVACGFQSIAGFAADAFANLPQETQQAALSQLENESTIAAGCELAALASAGGALTGEKKFAANPAAANRLSAWKVKNKLNNVSFCFDTYDGKKNCL